jgi:hypothetical protein
VARREQGVRTMETGTRYHDTIVVIARQPVAALLIWSG